MANSYLSRTISSSPTNPDKFTISMWVKRSKLGSEQAIMGQYASANFRGKIDFLSDDRIEYIQKNDGNTTANLITTRKFRDTSAWYHLVYQFDTSQGTSSNRIKLYVNGVQETAFDTASYPAQDLDMRLNQASGTLNIGQDGNSANYFEGYISHIALADGQTYAPTSFGQTDATSGIWKFISPSGITWGDDGFHLKMENSGNLGLDSSGQTNNFTVNGNLKQALDTPSNVYCTMNSLDNYYPASTFTTGNNSIGTAGSRRSYNTGTLGVSSGKWYWEVKAVSSVTASNGCWIGIASTNATNDGVSSQQTLGYKQYDYGFSSSTGNINTNNSQSSYGSGYGDNDIVGVAMDLDNNKLYFHVNGTYENSGVPTSGSTGTGAVSIQAPSGTLNGVYTPGLGDWWTSGFNVAFNFGNGFFGTTAIASAGSNGNGSLFEYDVPTGYYALNTKNINTYG